MKCQDPQLSPRALHLFPTGGRVQVSRLLSLNTMTRQHAQGLAPIEADE